MKYLALCLFVVLSACGPSQEKENQEVEKQAEQELANGF